MATQSGTLYAETLALVRADKRTLAELSQETGLPYFWLRAFRQGRIPNPGVNNVQALFEFLAKKELLAR